MRDTLSDGEAEIRRTELQPWNPIQQWWHSHKIFQVMKLIPRGPGKVLDLGCGCGDLFVPLLAIGKEVVGLDNDPKIIQYLRDNKDLENINLVCREALSTGFDDNSIDVVLVLSVIEHLNRPDKLIDEINRILKHDGILIIITPHESTLWHIIWGAWNLIIPYGDHNTFTKQDISDLLNNNGMINTQLFTSHFGCLIISVSRKVV